MRRFRCDIGRDIGKPAEPPPLALDGPGNTFADGDLLVFHDRTDSVECECRSDRM